jgi:ABC-type nitrate/sulfonate/bicarbonate transport system substrate-binding protein
MMEGKLFEAAAAELGYDLTIEWRDYPSALPMVEAFVGGNLDFGMWGNTPIVRLLSQRQPIHLLTVGEGHFRFVVATRPDSPIRNIEDLKGKTVGALLGGDPYNAFSQMLRYELGNADPKALGITMINMPTQAQAASMPAGIDAAVLIYPAFLQANAQTGLAGIVNSFGYTEAYYKGPAGEGAGHMLPSVRKSAFFPDGYYLHRSFWITSEKMVTQGAQVTVAFMAAQQRGIEALARMNRQQISDSVKKYWQLEPSDGEKVLADEVLFQRGWCWATEGDAQAVAQISNFMVEGRQIQQPLTWDQIKAAFAKSDPLMRRAYEMAGSKPQEAEFTKSGATDLRGAPAWRAADWKAPA